MILSVVSVHTRVQIHDKWIHSPRIDCFLSETKGQWEVTWTKYAVLFCCSNSAFGKNDQAMVNEYIKDN